MASINSISEPRGGFLSGLIDAPSIKQWSYSGKSDLLADHERAVNREIKSGIASDGILVSNVHASNFENELFETNIWSAYDPRSNLLLLRMPLPPHESAASSFEIAFFASIAAVGQGRSSLTKLRSTPFTCHRGTRQADGAWKPKRTRQHWPTIVLEVGNTESTRKLHRDVEFWLEGSNGEVKRVFAIKIHQRERKVTIEKWMRNPAVDAPIQLEQQIVVSEKNRRTVVDNAPLTIAFEDVFRRPPAGPVETNNIIQLTADDLRDLAEEVWEEQHNLA
ncbi:hypothetical protein BJX99DRAFT_258284 [Aspergillus californicus]